MSTIRRRHLLGMRWMNMQKWNSGHAKGRVLMVRCTPYGILFLLKAITDIDLRVVRKCPPPLLGPKEVFDLLLRLDNIVNPGLTVAEFQELFAKCSRCGLMMTRRIFRSHECVFRNSDAEIGENLTAHED
jgi:hypothetical protein